MELPKRLTLLLLLTSQLGCQGIVPSDKLSQSATAALHQLCTKTGARIDSSMQVRAIVEHEGTLSDKHVIGIRLQVVSGGKPVPSLTFGSVGMGTSAEGARNNAIEDWTVLFAEQYCAAHANVPSALRVESFVVYPSALGLRGDHPGGWLEKERERHERILNALRPDLTPTGPNEIGMIDVKIAVMDGGQPTGQCLVNASPTPAACERVTSLPWPPGTYIYKQAFAYRTAR